MIAVIEICDRMFMKLTTLKNDELATEKKITSASSVNTGAMLRSWSLRKLLSRPVC